MDQLVRWLAPLHYNAKHEQSIEKHEEDTGTWLFEKDIYRDWESLSPSSLWIHGIPGSGKTILAYIKSTACITCSSLISSQIHNNRTA